MTATTADITDLNLAPTGRDRIAWAERAMPVLAAIRRASPATARSPACASPPACTSPPRPPPSCAPSRPAAPASACAPATRSAPRTTSPPPSVDDGIAVFARAGEDRATYFKHLEAALADRPQLVMDDGADLTTPAAHQPRRPRRGRRRRHRGDDHGVTRLRAMAREGVLRWPVIAVNDAPTKHMFDNRYGTGQSTIDGILRATNRLLAGAASSCAATAGAAAAWPPAPPAWAPA
jgi:adenosylhomocysteinase